MLGRLTATTLLLSCAFGCSQPPRDYCEDTAENHFLGDARPGSSAGEVEVEIESIFTIRPDFGELEIAGAELLSHTTEEPDVRVDVFVLSPTAEIIALEFPADCISEWLWTVRTEFEADTALEEYGVSLVFEKTDEEPIEQ